VLTFRGGDIAEVTGFMFPHLFSRLRLPDHLEE
jgi:hypothetical protein